MIRVFPLIRCYQSVCYLNKCNFLSTTVPTFKLGTLSILSRDKIQIVPEVAQQQSCVLQSLPLYCGKVGSGPGPGHTSDFICLFSSYRIFGSVWPPGFQSALSVIVDVGLSM